MEWYVFQFDAQCMLVVLTRLLAACLMGGVIGFEREYSRNTPAGFRTHILVSLGSCLAMLISQFAYTAYAGFADVDPTRIGSQVDSGIGFLGAGAIIRHGVSVKGITTAASIWAVACVGLACGIGFFVGAAVATAMIWAVLIYLKLLEKKLSYRIRTKTLAVEAVSNIHIILSLNRIFRDSEIVIKSLEISESSEEQIQKILCQFEFGKRNLDFAEIVAKIKEIDGVLKVSI